MQIEDAIEIVLSLARDEVIDERDCDDEEMLKGREDALEAIATVEDFFVNVVFDGTDSDGPNAGWVCDEPPEFDVAGGL